MVTLYTYLRIHLRGVIRRLDSLAEEVEQLLTNVSLHPDALQEVRRQVAPVAVTAAAAHVKERPQLLPLQRCHVLRPRVPDGKFCSAV